MPSPELQRLWRLHLIDAAIVDIRKRAAVLDPGREIMADIKRLENAHAEADAAAHKLGAEQTDIELEQKGIEEKLKKIDRELYGGGVVNPREVETLEKEVANLKRRRTANDERLLGVYEQVPNARTRVDEARKQLSARRADLGEYQKKMLAFKHQLEEEFKRLNSSRPAAAAGIDRSLLARYDAIRNRQGGIGMAQVTKEGRCSACGMSLPEKTIEGAREDKAVTCESCHRLIYYTEGLV